MNLPQVSQGIKVIVFSIYWKNDECGLYINNDCLFHPTLSFNYSDLSRHHDHGVYRDPLCSGRPDRAHHCRGVANADQTNTTATLCRKRPTRRLGWETKPNNSSTHRETLRGTVDRNRKVSLPQVAAFQVILHHLVHNWSQEAVAVLEDGWVVRPGGFVGVVEELSERRVGEGGW